MPSPFPGMDPFIERFEWEDFHHSFIDVARERLTLVVGDDYLVRVERRVYLEHPDETDRGVRRADVALVSADEFGRGVAATALAAPPVAPVECLLPMPEERRESYLVIRDRGSREVVTVIELLSPSNKRPGGDGRREYLEKREAVLAGRSHLVELDLLRGGRSLPMHSPLPAGDYFTIVSRESRRPRAEVYAWTLAHPLPEIAVPLLPADGDVSLDLQTVHDTVYDRARYDRGLDYTADLEPPLSDVERAWMRSFVE